MQSLSLVAHSATCISTHESGPHLNTSSPQEAIPPIQPHNKAPVPLQGRAFVHSDYFSSASEASRRSALSFSAVALSAALVLTYSLIFGSVPEGRTQTQLPFSSAK